MKMCTVYNPTNNSVGDIGDNACRDMDCETAKKLLEVMPQLEIIGEFESDSPIEVMEEVKPEIEVKTDQERFEESLRADEKYFCSVCGKEFKSDKAMKVHLGHMHK
jgi:ABC-type enterochelin transport system substrate-binding protein